LTSIKNEEALSLLIDLGQPKSIKKGTIIAMEGESSEGFWWVLAGSVRIHLITPEGRSLELGRFNNGEVVAAALAFAEAPFPHHIEAQADSELLWFSRKPAWERITNTPELASFFLQILAAKCRLLLHRLNSQSTTTLKERLLKYLQNDAKYQRGYYGKLNQSKKDLANELGTTPETLSRALRTLCEEGIIEINNRSFRLLNDDKNKSY
jgi:CRP/FNR family transcriptional regulator